MAVIRLMRPLGAILVISSALAARAAADPIDDRADFRPQVEAGSPAPEGSGVADAPHSGAGLAPSPNATPRAGNPLWAIPLSALSATRDRPLFSTSRRPPIVAVPIVAPPPKQEALAPPPRSGRCLRWSGRSSAGRRASRCFKAPTPKRYPDSGLGRRMTAG